MAGGISAQPLITQGFSWVFLVELLVCGILALFFLFYFNRLFATGLGYAIRFYTWHKYGAYIDVSALQISLLGGRIFFKNIRYHAHNVTVFVYEGNITWRYWLRSVQEAELFAPINRPRQEQDSSSESKSQDEVRSSSDEKGEKKTRSRSVEYEERAGGRSTRELPCRILVQVAGVEAFVYNRSPGYDIVKEQTSRKAKERPGSSDSDSAGRTKETNTQTPIRTDTEPSSISPTISTEGQNQSNVPSFLRMFPVKVECKRAAATLGNENTTSVISAKLEKASGNIDAGHAGAFDLYRLLFNFDLEKINVTMKPNRDFKQLQLNAAHRILWERSRGTGLAETSISKLVSTLRNLWSWLHAKKTRKSVNGSVRTASSKSGTDAEAPSFEDPPPGQGQWHGLDRYLDDIGVDEHDEWRDVEYAKASTLADIDKLRFGFQFDIPGVVPSGVHRSGGGVSSVYEDDINGSKPPSYGMEFAVHGGFVTYGPWADRLRLNIQQIFFPVPYIDADPAPALKPGETRAWTLFEIFVSVEEDVTLRIPSREPSKDEKWQGRASNTKPATGGTAEDTKKKGGHGRRHKSKKRKDKQRKAGFDTRPYAWMDVTVKTNSTIKYIMDMFPRPSGFRNTLDVDVKGTQITSSVNHGLLWRTGAVSVEADLSQPIEWNTLRKWPFTVTIDDLELFILRDHLFLIIDLVNDWSSGAPSDFWTFVPYFYKLRLLLRNFVMYLNVNDANIVNNPADFNKNDFLTLEGLLDSTLDIAMDQYRPVRNWITFNVLGKDMSMRMLSPGRTTMHTFLKDKVMAELPKLTLTGSFSGHMAEQYGLVDTLRFDIVGTGLKLKAYGYFVRQLINIKENYFGDYMHFKTLEEFQDADEDLNVANVKTASLPKPKFINELDVILCIIAQDATLMLPTSLYSADEFVRVELPLANLDLRIVSYYLDMGLQLSPVSFFCGTSPEKAKSLSESSSSTQLLVKHVDLDGHRSFGLPPDEPAYISQWCVNIGAINGELSSSFVHDLAMGARAFIFGFQDRENALPLEPPSIFYEASFVQVRTDVIRIWFHVGDDALLVATDPVEVTTNDWAGDTFSQRISVLAPEVTFACIDSRSTPRSHLGDRVKAVARTYAFFQTGAAIDVVLRKRHFEEEKRKQQSHIRECDQRTQRAQFLIRSSDNTTAPPYARADIQHPAMPFPVLPSPLNSAGGPKARPSSIKSIRTSVSSGHRLPHKSSTSSLSASVRGADASPSQRARPSRARSVHTPSGTPILQYERSRSSVRSTSRQDERIRTSREEYHFTSTTPSVVFSSPYLDPYFALDNVVPDESNVPKFDPIATMEASEGNTMLAQDTSNAQQLDSDASQTSLLIQVMPGIRAYVEPRILTTVSQLLNNFLPVDAQEVMDTFHMDVLDNIANQQEQHHGQSSTLELQIQLPSAQMRVALPWQDRGAADQIDISLVSISTLLRIKMEPAEIGPREILAVHTQAESISACLGRPQHETIRDPAISMSISNLLVWVAVAASQSINATTGDTDFSISGEQAEYLTDLALRLVPMVENSKTVFQALPLLYRRRLLQLVEALTKDAEDIGDPASISRMTYILRAFPDHFRNHDSWKVLVRLRHTMQNMPEKILAELNTMLETKNTEESEEASLKIIDEWAQWHSWDIPNISQSVAFQMLHDEENSHRISAPEDKPTTVSVRSGYLRLAVEAEQKANEIVVEDTTIGVEITPPTAPTGLMLVDENTRTKTTVQTHAGSVAISVNWSAFGVAQRVLSLKDKLYEVSQAQASTSDDVPQQPEDDFFSRHVFHVVVSTSAGSISLETLNLRHVSRAESLKVSVIGTTQVGTEYGPCTCVIVNADTATTELYGPSERVWRTVLSSPSIYLDHIRPFPGAPTPAPSVTIALAYRRLDIKLLEQLPGLLHLAELVVSEEASQIMQLVDSAKPTTEQPKRPLEGPVPPSNSASSGVKVHIALLAGELELEVSLLQALIYQLSGSGASIRAAPSMTQDKALSIDFDVHQQSHRFINISSNDRQEQSVLSVPPINGHVGLATAVKVTSLSIAITMDRIDVDAAAIQGMVAMLGQPEVQEVISATESGVKEVQARVEDLKRDAVSATSASDSESGQIVFDVRFALLGVRVAAITPHNNNTSKAEIELGFGPLHLTASNKLSQGRGDSLKPEVRARVRDIGARVRIHEKHRTLPCGNLTLGLDLHFKSQLDDNGSLARSLKVQSLGIEVNAYPDTAAVVADVINHLQDKLRNVDLSMEADYLRRLRDSRRKSVIRRLSSKQVNTEEGEVVFSAVDLLSVATTVQLNNLKIAWLVDQSFAPSKSARVNDIVLSSQCIEFTTRGGQEARLTIADLQLQLVKRDSALQKRSVNSALLPEMTFSVAYWSVDKRRSLAFKAAGKPLEIRVESRFMIPVSAAQRSIESAIDNFKANTAAWKSRMASSGSEKAHLFDIQQLASILVEADFAGAQLYLEGSGPREHTLATFASSQQHESQHGRYGQFAGEGVKMQTTLLAPGIAMKLEYNASAPGRQATVNGEILVDASKNMLLPSIVPLVLEISHSVQDVMKDRADRAPRISSPPEKAESSKGIIGSQRFFEDDSIAVADPSTIFGKVKVDLGLRICRQEFGMTCQPIARVDASGVLDDFYLTVNTIESDDHGHFFAASAVVTRLGAEVKHVYSREPTFTFEIESIVLSIMNSKHLSGTAGISAILKIKPSRTFINGKQLQDLLLFREIWLPPEIRASVPTSSSQPTPKRSDEYGIQRYHSVAGAATFPWNATISIERLTVDVDLGQSIGRSSITIDNLWVSQTKSSRSEENLCVGLTELALESTGRMSGFVRLNELAVRTSIKFHHEGLEQKRTPLIQASAGFGRLLAKAAFDYQAFAFGDIEGFDFLMYNVHHEQSGGRDRLVAVLDCDKAYVFCTSTSASRALGLIQAFEHLIEEKQSAYKKSLRDIEKHVRRESTIVPTRFGPAIPDSPVRERSRKKGTITLHTDVVLTIGTISVGVFPSTFLDKQILKLEANNIQGRFAAGIERNKVASGLGMTLGQLQIALASVKRTTAVPKTLDVSIDDVVSSAVNAKGGTIMRVPRVVASMQTWQSPDSNDVDFIFKTLLGGKIDVGWNLSRIDFIKNMWVSHSRTLASRLGGKALPESTVRITTGPTGEGEAAKGDSTGGQKKITAEVTLPQSNYNYNPLEPPIIETPQLRDMGEATPPLEWVGLNRERLPNVTHQILIVSLLKVAQEVEDAYRAILGSS